MTFLDSRRPDISYAVTNLSKFLSIHQRFVTRFKDLPLAELYHNLNKIPTSLSVDINGSTLFGFVDTAHGNDLRRYTTAIVFTRCGSAIVCQ